MPGQAHGLNGFVYRLGQRLIHTRALEHLAEFVFDADADGVGVGGHFLEPLPITFGPY